MVLEGEAIVEIDGTRHAMAPNDTTWVPGNVPHRFINASDQRPMRVFWTYATIDATRTRRERSTTSRRRRVVGLAVLSERVSGRKTGIYRDFGITEAPFLGTVLKTGAFQCLAGKIPYGQRQGTSGSGSRNLLGPIRVHAGGVTKRTPVREWRSRQRRRG